jgi:hypothetical protein
MKIYIIALLVILLNVSLTAESQQNSQNICYVGFKLVHSRRIPNQIVEINIIRKQEETIVKVVTNPKNNDTQWSKTKIDTSFVVSNNILTDLSNNILHLKDIDLNKAFQPAGLDGTSCTVTFGTFGNTISYKFWTPDSMTDFRCLTEFLNICKTILKIGGLKPEEIL